MNDNYKTITYSDFLNEVYVPLYWNDDRWLVLYGGAGSGKSVFAAQKCILRAISDPGHRILIIRKVLRHVRKSCFDLLRSIISDWDLSHLWQINKSDMTLTYKPNGSELICTGMDDPEKIKSIANISSTWFEEPTEAVPADIYQLNLRIRGKTPGYKQHILTFNPISVRHWLKEFFFDKHVKSCRKLKTTYRDNRFIDEDYIDQILLNKDPNNRQVYLDGEWGVLEGLIYQPFDYPDKWPESFDETIYGLDFGFNNPTSLVRCDIKDQEVFLTEVIYSSGLTNNDLISRLESEGIKRWVPIYADSAEPARIEEIKRAGYNVYEAEKRKGSVKAGISFCAGLKIWSRAENENINAEVGSYQWRQDKDGNWLDEPEKANDHAMDAMRYALSTHLAGRSSMRVTGLYGD